MAATSSCYCVSSHGHGLSRALPRFRTARLRLVFPSAPSPRLSSHRILVSPDPPLDVAAGDATGEVDWPAPNDDQEQEQEEEDRDEGIGFQIQVSKVGKRNRRLVRARVRVHAPLEAVWATLTDYEGLADFIPGLSECRLLDQHDGFARLYQVGEQDLALGFKFNAKGTVDCYEGDMELLPAAGTRRREIAFNMIDGDFKLFQGKWSVEEENCKYLPGIKLGTNVIADPDLESAVKDANMLVFVTPHQFVEGICKKLVGKLRPGAEAISLIKGMEVKMEGPCMISKLIADTLGINCCVLMGANIANEIAVEEFSEATIGYRKDKEVANRWAKLFTTPYFLVSVAEDIEGVELCGTLKNIVAIAAGLVDGLDMGNNTKAAIMRIGLREMRAFSKLLFPSVRDNTFFESCGVADLITTCLGGRNRRVAEAFARNGGKRSFDELEAEMLRGQKLQGVSTAREVYEVLTYRGWQELFPLLSTVHEICIGQLPPTSIVEYSEHTPNLSIIGGHTPFY